MVEGIGVSTVFAQLPSYLLQMGVQATDRLAFVGLFNALIFVVGAPLVPLWGAWADKYSRKVVIVRSAVVEAVVFTAVALSREPWQLALSMLLIGLQLGNTGVMLAGIRDVTPKARLGTTIAIFGASGPIGFAAGPVLAGILIDGLGFSLPAVFASAAVLSIATAALVTFGSREIRPEVVPTGREVALAFGALLVGAVVSPLGGLLGDRVGFRPVLLASLGGAGIVLLAMPYAPSVATLALVAVILGAATSTVTAMVFGLLATEVPAERRSATLNLVYLPLYASGIIGPAIGAGVAAVDGVRGPFLLGGVVFIAGALAILLRRGRSPGASPGRR